ncbi:MAG: hypothetical protein J2P57_15415, partial [Acidimicrobiaceae bacterium]|nr:hypothetical protein [Acidimicrobiaceae bacterium]
MRTIRNRRARLIAGTVGLAIAATGLGLAAPGVASAATGLQPGALVLSPASGTPVATPAWTTTTACPSTESAAGAGIAVFDLSGNFIENVTGEVAPSAVTTPGFGSASPGDGAFASDMGQIAAIGGLDSSTVEFVVACVNSLDPVDFLPEMSTFVTFDAQGNWTSSATPPPPPPPGALNTATVLAASANPATVGQRVTLT